MTPTHKTEPSTIRQDRPALQLTPAMRAAAERAFAEQCNSVPMASRVGYVKLSGIDK